MSLVEKQVNIVILESESVSLSNPIQYINGLSWMNWRAFK